MRAFQSYPTPSRPGLVSVRDDEDNIQFVDDDAVGEAAQELLKLPKCDGLGITPAWMVHEVTYRAREIDPSVDPNYDFDVRENPFGDGATIIVLRNTD